MRLSESKGAIANNLQVPHRTKCLPSTYLQPSTESKFFITIRDRHFIVKRIDKFYLVEKNFYLFKLNHTEIFKKKNSERFFSEFFCSYKLERIFETTMGVFHYSTKCF